MRNGSIAIFVFTWSEFQHVSSLQSNMYFFPYCLTSLFSTELTLKWEQKHKIHDSRTSNRLPSKHVQQPSTLSMHWWVHFSHFHSLVLLFLYLLCVSLQSNEEAMSKLQITTCRKALEPRCVVFTTVTFWHDRFSFLPPGGSLAPSKIFRWQSFAIRGWRLSLLIFIWGPGRSWLIIKRRKK